MLQASLDTLGTPRVLVVGDLMLDEYLWGEVSRISPEAPVPVLAARHREFKVGGAGSVVENLCVLGAQVDVVALVGADETGSHLLRLLETRGVSTDGLVQSAGRVTTRKTRLMAYVQQAHRAQQQILRLDHERCEVPSDEEFARLDAALATAFEAAPAAVLVSDYEKGLLTEPLLARIIELAQARHVPVLIDPGRSVDYGRYRGATLLCPNRFEAQQATGVMMNGPDAYECAGRQLVERLGLRYAALTLDREGILLVTQDGRVAGFPTRVRTVADVAGAGDMVLTLLGLAFGSGWDIDDAIELANLGAGVEVSKVGVTPVERWELYQALAEEVGASKVRARDDLLRIVGRARAAGRRVVFTNGCFDILHAGHVVLLERARALGDLLIVGVNGDASVHRLKGPGRPINDAARRGQMLSALGMIDHVVFFDEDTPLELIGALRPDVLVKGGDYRAEAVVGREQVEAYGGSVELIPLVPHLSTTGLVERLRTRPGAHPRP